MYKWQFARSRLLKYWCPWFLHERRKISNKILRVSDEVASALTTGNPVVALESTIITHGLPFPQNLRMVEKVESIVRENDCVPATIAILGGKVRVGLSKTELEKLAGDPSLASVKSSRRDMAYVISKGLNGSMTVSGTMVAAHRVGISVFVTGGIGGVHRGAETSMDISADLTELGRTPITVVSAGVKNILDIGKTLEYLETQGVCVASYGSTTDFPAFFIHHSGLHAPYNVQTPVEAAKLIEAQHQLSLQTGILIAVPIPREHNKLEGMIEEAIETAVRETECKSVRGKEVTPYILKRVSELTKGASLEANLAFMENNAYVGSKIALELSQLKKSNSRQTRNISSQSVGTASKQPVVVGGSMLDVHVKLNKLSKIDPDGSTQRSEIVMSAGGVGRNIADCLSRLGKSPLFISAFGQDFFGQYMAKKCTHMDMSGVSHLSSHTTAIYNGILQSSGNLLYGFANADIHGSITSEQIAKFEDQISEAPIVCMDGNIKPDIMEYLCLFCSRHNIPVWFETTDTNSAWLPFSNSAGRHLTYISPNLYELRTIHKKLTGVCHENEHGLNINELLKQCMIICADIINVVPVILVTLGEHGVLVCHNLHSKKFPTKGKQLKKRSGMTAIYYPSIKSERVVSVIGAGDCLVAATIAGIVEGLDIDQCIRQGLVAAYMSLQSSQIIPDTISASDFPLKTLASQISDPVTLLGNKQ